MLTDAETRYTNFEQITFALRMASKKLCPYFQTHTIVVLSNYRIKAVFHKPDASRRLLKWVMELSKFDIEYRPRSAIKGQVLANFIVELSNVQSHAQGDNLWVLKTDGSS